MADNPVMRPPSLAKLGFKQRPMVRWLDPIELIQTGLRTAISTIFGEFADKRELQQALVHDDDYGFPPYGPGDLWLDFVADTGDGFESTYTIAYLLAQQELVARRRAAAASRGAAFWCSAATRCIRRRPARGYENRLLGPYEAALPGAADPPGSVRDPGNHDWYDGLTNFLRFFCNDGGSAAGDAAETQLLRGEADAQWWLWGIDIQFDAFIDEPQLRYFDRAALKLNGGDRVLLATGKPSWTDVKPTSPSYENLRYLEERIIETGGRVGRVVGRPIGRIPPIRCPPSP